MAHSDQTASLMTPAKLAQIQPRKAVTPAAWLDQMAADAGHAQVQRIGELCQALQKQAAGRQLGPVISQLDQLGAGLRQLDFDLLQPRGWWARTTGKGRGAGAAFAARFEEIDEATRGLAAQTRVLQESQQADGALTDRTLLELEVEYRSIDKIIDEGTRWLHDMRNQLKIREPAAATAAAEVQQQVRDDAARCDILVARLKLLRAVSTAAAQAHRQAQSVARGRAGLAQMLQQAMASDVKAWRERLSPLAAAGETDAPTRGLDGAAQTHRELQLFIKQAVADGVQLKDDEQVLSQSLAALSQQLAV